MNLFESVKIPTDFTVAPGVIFIHELDQFHERGNLVDMLSKGEASPRRSTFREEPLT
jgi:hypothetical protein